MQASPVALVTGGSFGIGLAIAQRFKADGYAVALVGRNADRLRRAVEVLDGNAIFVAADIGERAQVDAMVAAVVAAYGRIDVLVNNAGIMPRLDIDTPADEAEQIWDDTIRTNLKGAYLVARAVASHLSGPRGRIVNISSIVGQSGGSTPGFIAYTASKAGVNGLTLALARELAPKGVTVNAVAPGNIAATGMTGDWDEERLARIRAQIPLGRQGIVEDIAGTVAWLASADAAYVTGVVVPVNGGWRLG